MMKNLLFLKKKKQKDFCSYGPRALNNPVMPAKAGVPDFLSQSHP
jgi:hypothetical protein